MTNKLKPKKKLSTRDDLSHLAKAILANAGVGIYIVQKSKFVYVSELYQKITGYTDKELIGTDSLNNIHPEDREKVRNNAIKCLKRERFDAYEYRFIKKSGELMWVLETVTPIIYKGGRATLGSFMNITERKRMEEALRENEEKYRSILENIQEGYFEVDLAGNYTFFNDSLCQIHGYPREELMDMNNRRYTDKEEAKKVYKAFNRVYKTGAPSEGFDWLMVRKDGSQRYIEASASLQKDSSDKPNGFKGVIRDITERKLIEQELNHMATHDALTGLPNRLLFCQLLNHAIQSAQRNKKQLAVLFVDLDRFKIINDSLGHEAGDKLLQEIAQRFKHLLRAVDIVSRLGGDEFIILIEEVTELNQVANLAHKILTTAIQPMVLMGEECRVTASIGVSIYPSDGLDEQSLMKNADIAMYFAKEAGKNNYQFYSKNIQSRAK